jgi:predicted regulator of Ras-like GTPase activity (Roadblock/LC7/MglB family)
VSFFRNLFGRRSDTGKTNGTATISPPAASISVPQMRPVQPEPHSPPPAQVQSQSRPVAAPVFPATAPEDCIPLPLKAITDLFPPELKGAIRKHPSEHVLVDIPRSLIKPQLASGAVRITFAQLRAATPGEIFFHPDGAPADAKLLLPLEPILRRMKPDRRDDQRTQSLPANIPSVFAKAGPAPEHAANGGAEKWFSQRRPTYDVPDEEPEPKPSNGNGDAKAPEAVQPPAPEPAALPVEPAPAASAPLRMPTAPVEAAPVPPPAPAPVAATPVLPPPPAPAPTAAAPVAPPPPAPIAAVPAPAASAPATADTVTIPLSIVLETLPASIRESLNGADPATRSFLIPFTEFESQMRTGKLRFRWSQLQTWCHPEPFAATAADTDVDLPLAQLVPIFLATRKSPEPRKKIEVDSRIPEVFGKSNIAPGTSEPAEAAAPVLETEPVPAATPAPAPEPEPIHVPVAAPAPAPEPEPEPTPVPVAESIPAPAPEPIPAPAAEAVPEPVALPAPEAAPAPAATPFPSHDSLRIEQPPVAPVPAAAPTPFPTPLPLRVEEPPAEPVAMEAPAPVPSGPAQILHRIRALSGVSGTFLATSDGLLVAADLPDGNENVLSAFAPTVFSQLAKYSEMARLGQPEAIDLHLGGSSIHVRKVGKLFLGVITPRGRQLPVPELNLISSALQPHAT